MNRIPSVLDVTPLRAAATSGVDATDDHLHECASCGAKCVCCDDPDEETSTAILQRNALAVGKAYPGEARSDSQ